ncbi:sulfur carrier protein ThiS [Puniceicoccaceae bacterium K14]|nr:sulfur carrier protein ThiS [Puniceicoccaceae bacterium K14]
MTVIVNGVRNSLSGECTLEALMEQLGKATHRGIAVALNGSVVSADSWPTHCLVEGDEVLIIQATQGG